METFSALLAIYAGNSPGTGEFPAQRPVTRSFDVFFDVRLIKRLSKHLRGWWFETLSHPLWGHRNDIVLSKLILSMHILQSCFTGSSTIIASASEITLKDVDEIHAYHSMTQHELCTYFLDAWKRSPYHWFMRGNHQSSVVPLTIGH